MSFLKQIGELVEEYDITIVFTKRVVSIKPNSHKLTDEGAKSRLIPLLLSEPDYDNEGEFIQALIDAIDPVTKITGNINAYVASTKIAEEEADALKKVREAKDKKFNNSKKEFETSVKEEKRDTAKTHYEIAIAIKSDANLTKEFNKKVEPNISQKILF